MKALLWIPVLRGFGDSQTVENGAVRVVEGIPEEAVVHAAPVLKLFSRECGVAELAAKLRAHRPGIRLLFMSGYSETAVHKHGVIEAGAGLVQKPFTPETLARQVREALN